MRHPVTSIVKWAQCFTHYITVLSQAKPERTSDLLGYQYLILEAHLEYAGEGWMIYVENGMHEILWSVKDNEVSKTMKKPLMRLSKMVKDLLSR